MLGAAISFGQLNDRRGYQPWVHVAATAGRSKGFATPFEPSSVEGKLLGSILQKPYQRHLFQFALSQQLDELVSRKEQVTELKHQSSGSMEAVLNR